MKLYNKIFINLIILLTVTTVVFAQDDDLLISDDIFIFDVDDVVIEDARIVDDPVIRPGQVTVFDRSSIEASGAKTVADVVERAPGIVVSRTGGILEPQSVSIRGGAADHVLVLIDGKPAESLWSGGSDLSRIPVQNIERIEVIRGGGAAVYGEGAFSGVINIITVSDVPEEGSVDVEYGYASFNTHMVNAEVSGPIAGEAGISGRLAAGGLYTSGDYSYSSGGTGQLRSNNDGWRANVSGGAGWAPERAELSLSGDFKASEKGVPGLMEFLTPLARSEEMSTEVGAHFTTDTETAGVFSVDAGFAQNYSRYVNPDDSIDDNNSVVGLSGSAKWTESYELTETIIEIIASGGYGWDFLQSSALTDSTGSAVDGAADQHSADIRLAVNVESGQIDFSPAAGFDWNCSNYAGLAPVNDAAVSWSATLGWSPFRSEVDEGPLYLKTNVASSYKNPSFRDLFWPSGALASGNPDLKAEHGLSWDAGLYLSFPEPCLKFEVVGFIAWAVDLIQWLPAAGGIWRPKNIGNVLSGGAELSGVYLAEDLFDFFDLEASASYSWLTAIDSDAASVNYGRQLAYRPEHSGRAGMLLSIPQLLSLDFDVSYLGLRYTNNSNTKYLDPVLIFSASVNYDITEVFRISVTAENFTNQQYIDRLGYPIPGFEWAVKGRLNL